jgi:hypothetical protein
MHYTAAWRRGGFYRRLPEERFSEYFEVSADGCWTWVGHRDQKGYPMFYVDGIQKQKRAHRWAWETYVSPLAEGEQLHHLCRNTSCVNFDHLEVVTNAENQRRRWARTYCCADCGSENVRTVYADATAA